MTPETVTEMLRMRCLGWACVEIALGDMLLLIDSLENTVPLAPVMGLPRRLLRPVDAPARTHALITHVHSDYCGRELIARLAVWGTIGCHIPTVSALTGDGVTAQVQVLGEARRAGR
ncbi:hypothetical protein [Streptomyces sp. NPDC006285]|uniref:hypothetical protein n=1 Tax=Streptomyces sp. NPDC006285 TaxID=3364742 RepID=UPI003681C360